MQLKRPCRGCVPPKRHRACHDTCPDYLAEKAILDEMKAERDKAKAKEVDYIEYIKYINDRQQRGRWRK